MDGVVVAYEDNKTQFGPGSEHEAKLLQQIADGEAEFGPDDDRTPKPTWEEKRTASIADGGYGTWREQFEMIGEGTMAVYKTHIAEVKTRHPK